MKSPAFTILLWLIVAVLLALLVASNCEDGNAVLWRFLFLLKEMGASLLATLSR